MSAAYGFFTPEPVLYHGHATGFALFGAGHVASLALSAALVATLVARYLRLPQAACDPSPARRHQLLAMSGTAVAVLVAKDLWYVALGMFEPLFWPLHVCNLCELVALGHALSPTSRLGGRLADLLFCWGIPGCLAALLLPGWAYYCPAWSLASACGFVEHALVLSCALCVLSGGDYAPSPRRFWFPLATSIACGALFRAVNPLLGTNFFFVTNPTAAGGPGPWLLATLGDPGFLVGYLLLVAAVWAVAYGIWHAMARRHLREEPHA